MSPFTQAPACSKCLGRATFQFNALTGAHDCTCLKCGHTWPMAPADQVHSSAYGNCPKCGAPGMEREWRPNGFDTCVLGHRYPSVDALSSADRLEVDQRGRELVVPERGL